MIKDQIEVHVQLDSANMDLPIWQNLANIKSSSELAIVEVAVPAANIGPMRSRYIKPDVCVITELGFEHMISHGSIEALVKNKVSVVEGSSLDGLCVLNGDNQFYNDALEEVDRLRPDVKVVSFGHGINNDGRILSKIFDGNGWNVTISLKGDFYEYNVPFVEEFAPINSLMVLSVVYYLGLDINKSIAALADYSPFETHGGIFQLQHQGSNYTLYDQSYRGRYQLFISFFKTIKNINAGTGGRRILIMSQIVDDRDFGFFDFDEFIGFFKAANIDILYTVDKFKVHAHIIDGSTQWLKHGDSYADIIDDVVKDIQANDTIFIKGVHSSGLYKLAAALKNLASSN